MAGLEVNIGADIKDFKKKIEEVENDVQQLANEKAVQIKLGLDTKEITAQIKDAKKYLTDLKQTARDTGQSFSKDLSPKVANGGNALMQFSRIAQDAPFGIMGIGNNITATAESFGYLVKETGSAGGALKAVASSIMGSGGILLAVSLVTSGLTYMSQQGVTVGDVFRKLTGDFNATAEAMRKISSEAVKNSQGEISEMKAYVGIASNVNLSMQERLIAVKKLQDEYPAYFGNLSKEKILNGQVATTVDEVTKALKERARANAISSKVNELAAKQFEISDKTAQKLSDLAQDLKLNSKEAKELYKAILTSTGAVARWNQMRAEAGKSKLGAFDLFGTDNIREDLSELKEITAEIDRLTKKLNEAYTASVKLDFTDENKGKKAKVNVTPQVQGLNTPNLGGFGLIEYATQLKQLENGVYEAETGISTSLKRIPGYFKGMSAETMQALIDFNAGANALIKGAISDTFVSFGESISNALTNGTNFMTSFGNSILSIFGNLLAEFGKMLIKLGTGLVIADLALKSGNGYAAIAAGVALVAVASAFKSNSSKLSVAGAAGSSGGYSSGASYSSPSSTGNSSSSSSFGSGTVVFEIAGDRLIGVLQNTINKNKRLGGSLSI